jgi:DNA-binding NtrC family response regulator
MLQVIPPAFVPDPHPHPIREVRLDIPGFPEIRSLRAEVARLRAREGGLVGESPPMRLLVHRIERVASARVPVLVLGETGTGKELAARAVHDTGPRAKAPFVAENCGAFAESVLASELFGHESGAFTGAHRRHKGLFEQADGGTLFLDEVGELPARVQASLLRVLETGTLRRVGGEQLVRVDVRIVAATHRNLPEAVREGTFREDLYYRLRGAVLEVPALRERGADLERLVALFLNGALHQPTRAAWKLLRAYRWPGNVRELRAEVLRWTVFGGPRIDVRDLSPEITGETSTVSVPPNDRIRTLRDRTDAVERAAIDEALEHHGGNLSATARALGIDRNTLKRKLSKHGLR